EPHPVVDAGKELRARARLIARQVVADASNLARQQESLPSVIGSDAAIEGDCVTTTTAADFGPAGSVTDLSSITALKPGGVNPAPARSWVAPAQRSKYLMMKDTLPR